MSIRSIESISIRFSRTTLAVIVEATLPDVCLRDGRLREQENGESRRNQTEDLLLDRYPRLTAVAHGGKALANRVQLSDGTGTRQGGAAIANACPVLTNVAGHDLQPTGMPPGEVLFHSAQQIKENRERFASRCLGP